MKFRSLYARRSRNDDFLQYYTLRLGNDGVPQFDTLRSVSDGTLRCYTLRLGNDDAPQFLHIAFSRHDGSLQYYALRLGNEGILQFYTAVRLSLIHI